MAKELSKTELEAMTKFAPAYFEYMSNALTSNVSCATFPLGPHLTIDIHTAPNSSCQDIRFLQDLVQEPYARQNREDESTGHGKPVLWSSVFKGLCLARSHVPAES
jgi:hypothetical protein